MLKRFIRYYRPHWKLFTLDMIASLLISAIGICYPIVTNRMLNIYIPDRMYRSIVIAGIVVLAFYAMRYGLRYFVQYYGHIIGVEIQATMRSELFAHLEKLPYSFFDEHETGKIMSRMKNDLWELSELAHHGPENLIIGIITIIGAFAYLCTVNVILTLLIFACVPILFIITWYFRKKMHEAFKARRESQAEINGALESSISGIRVTKAFNNAEKEQEKFEINNLRLKRSYRQGYIAMAQFFSSTQFVTDVFNVVVLIAGGLFLYQGKITFGDYSSFIVSISLFTNPVNTLINFMEQYQNGATGFSRFCELMDVEPEHQKAGVRDLDKIEGEVEFDNVSFQYEKSEEVLHNVSFKLEKGKTLALVGPSGGGKTTICHLIPNFYPVTEGAIRVDGVDINDVTFSSLRQNVGIVQQDVFLFNGTVRENIMYGRLDASEEEMIEAAKRANIHEYVMQLPNGYETQVGERGVKLSGGQKQRISIARVFLKNPSILILDEATSALDNATEILIQNALDELCKGRTTIVVAHRLSTIKHADEIAVVSKGKIVEKGSHEELLRQDGVYAGLYKLQFRDGEFLNQ